MYEDILNSKFVAVSPVLVSKLGAKEALFFCYLAWKSYCFGKENQLLDGYFFHSAEEINRNIGLTYREQQPIIKKLLDAKILDFKNLGTKQHGRVRYFKILPFKWLLQPEAVLNLPLPGVVEVEKKPTNNPLPKVENSNNSVVPGVVEVEKPAEVEVEKPVKISNKERLKGRGNLLASITEEVVKDNEKQRNNSEITEDKDGLKAV